MPTIKLRDVDPVVFLHNVGAGGVLDPDQALEVKGIIHISEEQSSTPSAPSDTDGGLLYTKADGKLYWRSSEISEVDLSTHSAGGGGGGSGDIEAVNITAGTGLTGTVNTGSGTHTQTIALDDPANLDPLTESTLDIAGTDSDQMIVWDDSAGIWKYITVEDLQDAIDTTASGGSLSGGVVNKLAIWSGTDALTSDTDLHWDSTNNRLGVGTNSPAVKLEISETTDATPARLRLSCHSVGSIVAAETIGDIQFYSGDLSTNLLGVVGSIRTIAEADFTAGEGKTAITFHTNTNIAGTLTEVMRLTSDGKVGIGTGSGGPDQKLSVVGNIEARSGSWFIARSSDNAGYSYIKNPSTSGSEIAFHTSGEKMRILSNGNVGIGTGTGTLSEKLQVVGDISAEETSGTKIILGSTASAGTIKTNATTKDIGIYNGTTLTATIKENAVGILNSNPDGALCVGSLTTSYSSDISDRTPTPTYSGTDYGYGGTPAGAFDNDFGSDSQGNSGGWWSTYNNQPNATVDLDFGSDEEQTIAAINMKAKVDNNWQGVKSFKFQASNATSNTWDSPVTLLTVTDHPYNSVEKQYTFTNTTAYRYYRFLAVAGQSNNYMALWELEYKTLQAGTAVDTFKVKTGNIIAPIMPTADPGVAGALWNDSNTVKISAG